MAPEEGSTGTASWSASPPSVAITSRIALAKRAQIVAAPRSPLEPVLANLPSTLRHSVSNAVVAASCEGQPPPGAFGERSFAQ